jgi:triacylglycerol lipase
MNLLCWWDGRLVPRIPVAGGLLCAVMLLFASGDASARTTSPFAPPEATDTTFVVNAGPGLDTGCTFREEGPLRFSVQVTRYVGEINADGTLRDARALVAAGAISPTARLTMPGYDVDYAQGERDRVLVNGQVVGLLNGSNNSWVLNSFEIPIERLKFPAKGVGGAAPTPRNNDIEIDIDIAYEGWCTAVDWAAISFKALSPIVLVHGNMSNPAFFERQGFTPALRNSGIPFDDSILTVTSTVSNNGWLLDRHFRDIARRFGVDSMHLVAHSKGGLDSREFLARYHASAPFKVLSLTTLSTPHNGSLLADLQVEARVGPEFGRRVSFPGFPAMTGLLTRLVALDTGTTNLTTTWAAAFNGRNVAALPGSTVFNTVAADADLNGNGRIDQPPLSLNDEVGALAVEDWKARTPWGVDTAYQILRNSRAVNVRRVERTLETSPGVTQRVTIVTLASVPNVQPLGNDALVTIPSGLGLGWIARRTSNSRTFTGSIGRNHASVADGAMALNVLPWIVDVERRTGDLRP